MKKTKGELLKEDMFSDSSLKEFREKLTSQGRFMDVRAINLALRYIRDNNLDEAAIVLNKFLIKEDTEKEIIEEEKVKKEKDVKEKSNEN